MPKSNASIIGLAQLIVVLVNLKVAINQAPGFIGKYQKHTKTGKFEHQKLKI